MQSRSILAVFAHPDDEAFGSGGTLAHYAAQDVYVALVCATRGEVGGIADPTLATLETLGTVREGELRCAAQALGLHDVILLDYRDSGMAGADTNNDARAFMNVPAEEVVAGLVGLIRRLQPRVVITFDPNGGYGHPDHIAIHRHTLAAVHAAGDPGRFLDQGPPWQPSRVFYAVIPRGFFLEMREHMQASGIDTSQWERFEEQGVVGWPDDQIHLTLDVTKSVDAKWAALHCHATQFGADNPWRRLPEETIKQMMSREHFALAWPEPTPGQRLADLFDGL